MVSLWKHYDRANARYERSNPPAFPWNRTRREDVPRYVRGDDGYWYDPAAAVSGKALLSCVGDLMCEPRMTNAHRYGDSHFFHPLFRYVRDILRASDFAVANLETTVTDCTPYAGEYHCIAGKYHCNAPDCYLDAVRYAGFDALVTANNHNCDSGITGLADTLRAVDRHGFMRTGAFLPQESERVLLVRINGIRVAILSYGNRYNDLDEWHFTAEGRDTYLNWFTKEKALRDVAYARAHGAEFVLCYVHWGRDYDREPNEQQCRVLGELKDTGVDYIVGSHTHCLQSHHTVASAEGRTVPLMYSMGNFVTNERQELCKHTGILQLILRRDGERITAEEYLIPCYVFDEFGTGRFCVVPTDSVLNGGYAHERMPSINDYIRGRVGDDLAFLPSKAVTLSALCDAMGVALPPEVGDRPVTTLALQSGAVRHGALYFAMGEQEPADRRRLIAANVAAVVTTEPIAGFPCLVVSDVKAAYLAANAVVRRFADGANTVLITGASGKTVTRDLVTRVLRRVGGVLSGRDGLHPTVSPWQDVHPYHEYIVTELRDDNPLGTRDAVAACRPDTVIVTAAPCDLDTVAQGMASGGLMLINGADEHLTRAAQALDRPDINVRTYTDTVPCPGLPFDSLAPCTAAAVAVGDAVGLSADTVRDLLTDYVPDGYTQADLVADGVRLVLNLNTKTQEAALSALRAAAAQPADGNRIAVLAAPSAEDYSAAFTDALHAWKPDTVLTLGDLGMTDTTVCADLGELERHLLTILREGDTLLMIGARAANLCETVRRVFGLTDGFLPGAT